MKYINEILWFLSWPVLIYVSYKITLWAIKFWEKKFPEQLNE
ncbi:MAG: hypothetical protein PWR03_1612 [Tenuifilum sp.]|nr:MULTISPECIES: hypothetical protein [Tenuifilum]MDI3527429.1 hypothetical protein [Tenuifilum sp.]